MCRSVVINEAAQRSIVGMAQVGGFDGLIGWRATVGALPWFMQSNEGAHASVRGSVA